MTPDAHEAKELATSNVATLPLKPSAPCIRKLVLVDFENVPNVSLEGVDVDTEVIVFIGVTQKSAPIELAMAAQQLGERLQWRRVGASGKNALDFFIACELGKVLVEDKGVRCIVVSNDTGFDPLIKHLNAAGLQCSRKGSIANPAPKKSPAPKAQTDVAATEFELILSMLRASAKNRPAKRSTLKNHIAARFQNKKPEKEVERIITRLESDGRISLTGDKVTYKL